MDGVNLQKGNVRRILFIIIISILVFLGVQNFPVVLGTLGYFIGLLKPFIMGVCIAFALNVLLKLLEEKLFGALNRKGYLIWLRWRRAICILLTYAIVITVLFVLVFMIVPQLKKSFELLISNLNVYATVLQKWTDEFIRTFNISDDISKVINLDWNKIFDVTSNFLSNFSNNFINKTVNITSSIISGVVNLVLGIAFSIYMLFQKERLCTQSKKLSLAILSRERAEYLISIGKLSNDIFSKFVLGQLTEAIIIGFLCFLGMTVFSMPYASLIGTIVGFTSLIPIVGAFIGTIFGVFILLMINPTTAFWFVVFIIVLQQIEGNIIYPRVVGNSVGLPGIWVLLAVSIGGSAFGITGMILGIPLSSIAYCILRAEVAKKLKEKNISKEDIKNSGIEKMKDMENFR